jgi:hypothetical protein
MRVSPLLLSVALLAGAAAPAGADVQLSIQNGHVSLKATNATAREILAEWTKIGQTRFVNAERVPGGPMTLQLTNVSEEAALRVILRSAAGYVTAPRRTVVANASRYDRILVMPTTAPARGSAPPPAPFSQPPAAAQFQQFPPPAQFRPPIPINEDPNADDAPLTTPNPRGPIFNTFPPNAPQQIPPGAARPATPAPNQMPTGVAVPGMVVPAPAQPGQPGPQIREP